MSVALFCALLFVDTRLAWADSEVVTGPSQLIVDMQVGNSDQTSTSDVNSVGVPVTVHQEQVCEFGGAATCAEYSMCPDQETVMTEIWTVDGDGNESPSSYYCPIENVEEPPEITNEMVARAFRRIPLPASELIVQPPGGETLVNFATNFYTEAAPFERSVTLVGQQVDLRIWPSAYGWEFGDGAVVTTSEPGSAYPELEITHAYLNAGEVGASVDTTYSAEFRVNGGPWEPVVGTVTMQGEPVGLLVRTASPTLVGYH